MNKNFSNECDFDRKTQKHSYLSPVLHMIRDPLVTISSGSNKMNPFSPGSSPKLKLVLPPLPSKNSSNKLKKASKCENLFHIRSDSFKGLAETYRKTSSFLNTFKISAPSATPKSRNAKKKRNSAVVYDFCNEIEVDEGEEKNTKLNLI